jgi:predicted dienelactone hydrolase
MRLWLTALIVLGWAGFAQAAAVGFERVSVPVAGDRPLAVAIWYPSTGAEVSEPLALGAQTVAHGGPIAGSGHGLIVISHGTGGSNADHFDTAQALARAGFVVAAVSHTGDTYDDRSRALRIVERPRQLSLVIDYMTADWRGRANVNAKRIGAFGFSSGGFTVLAAVGGKPDMSLLAAHCAEHPRYFDCSLQRQFNGQSGAGAPVVAADPRIRAAVVAAPALGFTFAPAGLSAVTVPVQLWRAEADTVLPHPLYAEAVRSALPKPPEYHVVAGADHYDFLPPCSPGLAKVAPVICGKPAFDRAAFHTTFNAEVVRFFQKTLG